MNEGVEVQAQEAKILSELDAILAELVGLSGRLSVIRPTSALRGRTDRAKASVILALVQVDRDLRLLIKRLRRTRRGMASGVGVQGSLEPE